jgi:hypothetical protein
MKMAKSRKIHSIAIHDFFWAYNTYRVFALKSDLSVYNFANKLSKTLQVPFTALSDFDFFSDKLSAQFAVFYAEYTQKEPIHCFLLENKTETNQQELFDSKTAKNSNLINYSLFKEPLYLFNNIRNYCLKLDFSDMDFILLLFSKKDSENEPFSQFLKNIAPFNVIDASYLLHRKRTSVDRKNVDILEDFFCKYEVSANQFLKRRKMDLLAPVKQIPNINLQYPIPVLLEHDSISDNLQLSDEYLALLREE